MQSSSNELASHSQESNVTIPFFLPSLKIMISLIYPIGNYTDALVSSKDLF